MQQPMVIVTSQKTDKKEFRVKFTNNQKRKRAVVSKQLILGQRARFNTYLKQSVQMIDSLEDEPSEASKQQLNVQPIKEKEKIDTTPYDTITTSAIITNFDTINRFFGGNDVNYRLIYRASNHSFSVKAFHQMCDQYNDTLILCLTEDNKVIGGFTPLTWEDQFHRNSTHFKTDFKRQTFLFSYSDDKKYSLAKSLKNKAICCFKGYGPTFGGGYDLLIGDRTDQQPNTTSYFPRSYGSSTPGHLSKRDFTGTSRKNFKLQEWEVFHVTRGDSFSTFEHLIFDAPDPLEQHRKERTIWEKFKICVKEVIKALCAQE